MKRRLIILVASIAFALAGCSSRPAGHTASSPLDITLLHINDHHSQLDETTTTLMLRTASGKREKIRVALGGFPRVTAAMKALSTESDQAIKVHAGDATTGDLYFSLTGGQADADLMNTVCFDAFTLGNHEFDNGDTGLKVFLDFLRTGSCKTKVLSANIRFGANSALYVDKAPGYVLPSTIIERKGQKIGVIGVTGVDKTQNSSRPDPGTTFIDELASTQAEIDKLKKQGIDKIVLLSHLGYRAEQKLARQLRGVDVIVGGDSHSLLGPPALKDYGLSPEGDYPTLGTDLDGKRVCIVQAWQYAYVVGQLNVSFDEQGDVIGCSGRPHVLIGDDYTRADDTQATLSDKDIAAIQADIAAGGVLRPTVPDAAAAAALEPYKAQKLEFGSSVAAISDTDLCVRRVPGSRRDSSRSPLGDLCNHALHVDAHGGDVQQMMAQALFQQGKTYFKADLSLLNAGGIRVDLKKGPITVKDIYTLLPFKNTLVQLKATGAEIKAVLESVAQAVVSVNNTGAYPYAGGLRWTLDLNRSQGSRYSDLEVSDAAGAYHPLELERIYNVATIDFIADGHDHYSPFKAITGKRRIDVGLDATVAFLDYIRQRADANGVITRIPSKDYSTQRFTDTR